MTAKIARKTTDIDFFTPLKKRVDATNLRQNGQKSAYF